MIVEFIKKSEFSLDGYSIIKASIGDKFDLPEDLSAKFISRGLCKATSKEPETTESSTELETTEANAEPENKAKDEEDEDDFFGDSNKPTTRRKGRKNRGQ